MNPLELAATRSRWAERNVGEKALLFFGLILLALTLPPLPALPIIVVVTLGVVYRCSGQWRLYFTLCLAPLSFLAIGIIPLMLTIGTSGIEFHSDGWQQAALVFARSTVATAIIMGFALCTPISELIAWSITIGMPTGLVYVIMMMYRMITILFSRARAMWEAQGMRLGRSRMSRWIFSSAGQAAGLFVLSINHSRRLAEGLELRAEPTAMLVVTPKRAINLRRVASYLVLFALIILVTLL